MKNNPMQSINAAIVILRFQAGLHAAVNSARAVCSYRLANTAYSDYPRFSTWLDRRSSARADAMVAFVVTQSDRVFGGAF
jgi:hypothetical protein